MERPRGVVVNTLAFGLKLGQTIHILNNLLLTIIWIFSMLKIVLTRFQQLPEEAKERWHDFLITFFVITPLIRPFKWSIKWIYSTTGSGFTSLSKLKTENNLIPVAAHGLRLQVIDVTKVEKRYSFISHFCYDPARSSVLFRPLTSLLLWPLTSVLI